jgi:hypothetical protein
VVEASAAVVEVLELWADVVVDLLDAVACFASESFLAIATTEPVKAIAPAANHAVVREISLNPLSRRDVALFLSIVGRSQDRGRKKALKGLCDETKTAMSRRSSSELR